MFMQGFPSSAGVILGVILLIMLFKNDLLYKIVSCKNHQQQGRSPFYLKQKIHQVSCCPMNGVYMLQHLMQMNEWVHNEYDQVKMMVDYQQVGELTTVGI